MAYGNGTFIGVGGGFDFISHDGSNWTVSETSPVINSGGIAFGDGMFLAFGTNNQHNANYVLQSTNGITWTPIYTSSNTLVSAAYGNNTWVFIGTNDIATATLTSSNWNWSELQPGFSPYCITYGNGMFVIGAYIGNFYLIFSSSDGITWQYNTTVQGINPTAAWPQTLLGIAYGNGVFVASEAFPYNGTNLISEISVSTNLVNWTTAFVDGPAPCQAYLPVAFGGNQFIAGFGNYYYTSSDGNTWLTNGYYGPANSFTYGEGTFVAADTGGAILQSVVFATDSNAPPTTLGISTYAGVTINGTAGAVYRIQCSTDLNTWQTLTNFMLPYSPYVWVDTSSTVAGRRFYRSIQLQ